MSGSRRRRGIAWLALAVIGAAVAPAEAKDKPVKEIQVAIEPAPKAQPGLLDCRSPVVAHEVAVALGQPWEFAGNRITFTVAGKGLEISVQEPGAEKSKPANAARLPFLLPVKAFDLPYALSVRLDREGKHAMVASAFGVAVTLGSETAYLVDSDRDGTLGSEHDGVVAPQCRTVAAWSKTVWSRQIAAEVRRNETSKAWEASPAAMPYPERADHAAGWRLLEWRRQQCGLLPLAYDKALEVGMLSHAEYSMLNPEAGHEEEPQKPGFTAEGDTAGRECVWSYDEKSFVDGLEEFFATVFHRNGCLRPDIARTAMVLHRGVFGLRTLAPREGPLQDAVLVYPSHGMAGVATRFNQKGEQPRPAPGSLSDVLRLGSSLAVHSWPWRAEGVGTLASIALETGNEKQGWTPVPGNVYFSAHPSLLPSYDGRGTVAFVPDGALASQAAFRARALIPLPNASNPDEAFRYEWAFTTAK